MSRINSHKAGLALGLAIGGLHVIWSLLVLLGWAQPFMNFIHWAHMLDSFHTVTPFDPIAALSLIVLTSIIGYVVGRLVAASWNKVG